MAASFFGFDGGVSSSEKRGKIGKKKTGRSDFGVCERLDLNGEGDAM